MHTIELGAKVRDQVSGYTGTVTARYEYLNGCERYEISGSDKDGKPEAYVFDVQQIEVIGEPEPTLVRQPAPTGGPKGSSPVPR